MVVAVEQVFLRRSEHRPHGVEFLRVLGQTGIECHLHCRPVVVKTGRHRKVPVGHVDGGGQLNVDRVGGVEDLGQERLQLPLGDRHVGGVAIASGCRYEQVIDRIDRQLAIMSVGLQSREFVLDMFDAVCGATCGVRHHHGLRAVGVES